MGGKHKQAQRIKNNARPSSSGRSAELLASTSQIPQFSSVKEIRFVPPTLSLMKTEEFDTSVSPAFQIVLKKMNKKDCTTKIKALQEFSDLVAGSEVEAIKTILAFWTTLYTILATDTDHRVREAVHNAHYQIVTKDKKLIAPFLKQLIGPWFTSQYDNYPPAASAAGKSFTAAFPPNKVQDCVVFCQKEILTYIHDNLTTRAESSSKSSPPNEEAEAKFERIVISTLQGYCLYIDTLTDEQIQKNTELNKQIVTNSRFLKLATHKTPLIRATWFKVLATLYHKAPFLLNDENKNIVPVIFNNLDESEPAVVGFVWEAALLIMELVQDWWKNIHVEKNYLSKLKKILREGGQGNASVIYPNLLTVLHKLPPSLRADQFYEVFFENLRLGLKRKNVLFSKSESAAVVTAIVECLKYVILINQENGDLCEKLIKTHLLPLVEWSLRAENVCFRTVFHQITLLVQYWNRNKLQNYPKYLELFWSSLVMLLESIDECNQDLGDRQVTLIQNLKHVAKPKEQMKVKFSKEVESGDSCQITSIQIDEAYTEKLILVTYTVIKSHVRQIQEKKSTFLLANVLSLVRLFESEKFLSGLAKNFNQNENLLDIYKNLLYEWLKTPELSSEIVVELAFVLLRYIPEDGKSAILTSFFEFCEKEPFAWCVQNAFSHPHNQDGVVQGWIKCHQVGEFLVATTDANLKSDCPANLKNLVKLAFTENQDGDLLIDKDVVSRIIEKVKAPLLKPENFSTSIDSCAHLASYVTDMIYTENSLLKCGEELLLGLFHFSCNDHSDLEFLTEDTQYEVNTSWQDVVTVLSKNLPKQEMVILIEKFVRLVELNFLEKFPSEGTINVLTEAIVDFIKAVFNGQPMMISDVFHLFFNREFLPTWRAKIEELCIEAEYLNGSLANPSGSLRKQSQGEQEILRYFVWSLIKVSVLSSPLESREEDEDEEEEAVEIRQIVYIIDDNKNLISDLLYDLAVGQSFLSNYKINEYFAAINEHCDVIKIKTEFIMEKLKINDDIKQVLVAKANSSSFLWCTAISVFQEIISRSPDDIFTEFYKVLTNDLSKLHLCQTYGPYLNFDHVDVTSSVFDSIVILRTLSHCSEIDVQIAEVFEKIKKLRTKDNSKFILDNNDVTWLELETITEIIRLFSRLVKNNFDCLSRQHWDLGVICLSSWASNCYKLRTSYKNEQIQSFTIAIVDFYMSLNVKMAELKANNVKNTFAEEWEDLFLPEIHADLLQLWLYLADQFVSMPSLPIEYYPFVKEFGKITDSFVSKLIFNKETTLPNWNKILKRCVGLLVNSSTLLQLWGYKMLLILIPGLIEIDMQSDSSSKPNTKGFTIEQFKEILQQTDAVVDGVLAGFKLGEDSCQVAPFTDSYTYVFAYLLLWGVLFNLCEKSPPELRYQYADWLRNENYFKNLLNNLFKLMPTEILHYCEGKAKAFSKMFLKEPTLTFTEPCTSEQLEHAACWIYAFCLSQLPALVRQWWSETETKVTQIVERVTSFYVSPQLCNQELSDVGHRENKFKNMTIKIIPSVREVIAIYTVDEAQMELVITLPQNYPLGGPDVRCSRQIGGPLHKQWLMQLKKYLLHQNGRIWDGLSLWNSSLDKKFDGVEECYICFAVLHPGTYQLPKLTCQTCKKKFHSACLYKWFSTSNKNSCPICRNLF